MTSLRPAIGLFSTLALSVVLAGCSAPAGVELSPVGDAEAGHAGFSCPPEQYVVGFDAVGAPRCAAVPSASTSAGRDNGTGTPPSPGEAPAVDGAVQPLITGSCTGLTYMQSILSNGDVACGEPPLWTPQGTCSGGEFAVGYDANGDPVCDVPAGGGGSVAGPLVLATCDVTVGRSAARFAGPCALEGVHFINADGPRFENSGFSYVVPCTTTPAAGTILILKRVDDTPSLMQIGVGDGCVQERSISIGPRGSAILAHRVGGWTVVATFSGASP